MADEQIAILRAAYAQIGQTATGGWLEAMLENSPNVYTITNQADPANGGSPADYNPDTKTIHVNTGYHPVQVVRKSCGKQGFEAFSTMMVLLHEIGHAATFIYDEDENIAETVNPFRAELGLGPQLYYGAVDAFSWRDPIVLPFSGTSIVIPNW